MLYFDATVLCCARVPIFRQELPDMECLLTFHLRYLYAVDLGNSFLAERFPRSTNLCPVN